MNCTSSMSPWRQLCPSILEIEAILPAPKAAAECERERNVKKEKTSNNNFDSAMPTLLLDGLQEIF